MNFTMAGFILFGLALLVIGVLWFLFKHEKEQAARLRDENEGLRATVDRLTVNVQILRDHDASIKALQAEKAELLKKIKGAKTDEEANEILAGLIGRNNARLRSH